MPVRAPDQDLIAASFEQERAYVLSRLQAGEATQNAHRALLVCGALSPDALRQAIDRATARHEILRTSLGNASGRLVQVVQDRLEPDFTFEDLSAVTGDQSACVQQLTGTLVERPFDLAAAPLWRVLLLTLGTHRHVAVLCMHAAVADAETFMLLLDELLERDGAATGRASSGARGAPAQYWEHAVRQGARDEELIARQKAYWLDYLRGDLQPAELPMRRSRPAVRTARCGSLRRLLSPQLTEEARALAGRAGSSLAAVATAAFAALLHRYGNRSEATFAHVVSARRREAGEMPLGPCGNVSLMRLAVSDRTTFEEALNSTTVRLAEAEANQDYPFQQLARALDQAPDPDKPLARLLLESELDLEPAAGLSRPGELDVDDYEVPHTCTGDDVRVTIRRLSEGVALDWVYKTDLYEPELIARAADHVVQLLSAALADPSAPIAELAYLSAADEDAIKLHWNTTRTPYRRCAVHRLIEEQVVRTPHATAVEFHDQHLSYAELDRRANRLARHLMSLGASAGDMVGLCMDRSIDLIVAVVAILKAGCAVVPLDLAYPQSRLQFMLADADVRMVVTARTAVELVPALAGQREGVTLVAVDADEAAIAGCSAEPLRDGLAPESAAYCLYTSGSTGRPKGVVMEHAALANLVAWHLDAWLATAGTRTLLYSPISFDVAFHEILAGLCSGATLVQVDEQTRRNPIALLEFVREQRIKKWYMPFVTLQQVAQVAQTSAAPGDLEELIVGGEILRITPAIREFARRTECAIHNHYGSTECIDVATHELSGDPSLWPSVAPIGRATVHNMNLYILDSARHLLPVGVVGEIYAEGDCLAREYHRRPDLTAERFSVSPFGIQGRRLYRMGDLGRYLPDGTIECLGRADNQVKIRGYRVEPSEVEAVLTEHPAVAECAVTAKVAGAGGARLLAYVVARHGHDGEQLPEELRTSLADSVPGYMVPAVVVVLDALPTTPSGKVDVQALPEPRPTSARSVRARSDVERSISRIWCELLGIPALDVRKTFFELGGDSLLLVRAHQRIAQELRRELPADTLFRYPTVEALAQFLGRRDARASGTDRPGERPPAAPADRQLAIIGMACRVPGAEDVAKFWSNLRDGVESIETLSEVEVLKLESDQTRDRHFVAAAAMLPDIDLFDGAFFGYSAAEAAGIDPQQRLFLECAWEAIEDAGVDPDRTRIGVYAGASLSTYLVNNVLPAKLGSRTFLSHRHFDDATDLRLEQGNANDHLPTRVSFKLNLRGPSVNVQSACSTSLVAVHLARQALLDGDCDIALAGGVSIVSPQNTGYLWREGMILAPDGHCRAFDAGAAGTVFGNGLGSVVLKRLSAALADGDHIYAVIKGSAVNNDGSQKLDYAAPSVAAQADVVARAHLSAGVRADEISYVEAHGTGTKLGDPIEIAGLREAFQRSARRDGRYCAIGSVKTNIGHLDEAAGVIGLIKAALSLYHAQIPPSLHFRVANPLARLEDSPFFVNDELRDWLPLGGGRRRAGVSSFGMGGTNCHVVLEEPPDPEPEREPAPSFPDRAVHILPISARSSDALRGNARRYLERLEGQHHAAFADICFSAATGRRQFDTRVAVLATNTESARSQLAAMLAEPDLTNVASRVGDRRPPIAFLCTGQGSQYAGMGRALYEAQPVFRDALSSCDEILRPLIGRSVVAVVYASEPDPSLADTRTAQPALFAVGYALSRLWESWGVTPDLLIGHSLGEYVAACVAGVFGLEDGLKLVAERGRLMQELPRVGGMAQVNAGATTVDELLAGYGDAVAIAAVNAPECTVISGRRDALDAICCDLRARGVDTIALDVSHAFHSPLMAPMLEPFRAVARTVRYSPPAIDIVSNVTGRLARSGEMESADYWVRHIASPVQFYRAMQAAGDLGMRSFVEVGPKPTLSGLGRQCLTAGDVAWLPSLTPRNPDAAIASYRELYLAGAAVDWQGFDAPFRRRRVRLPTYAFQRERHWIERDPARESRYVEADTGAGRGLAARDRGAERHGTPTAFDVAWQPVAPVTAPRSSARRFVVIGDGGLAAGLIHALEIRGHVCVGAAAPDSRAFATDPSEAERAHVVFAPEASGGTGPADAAARLLTDVRRIVELSIGAQAKSLWLATREGGPGAAAGEAHLGRSGMAALGQTINAEHPELDCVVLTVAAGLERNDLELVARLLGGEAPAREQQLAVRGGRVYGARLRARPPLFDAGESAALPIRPDGTYVITGGTGGLGLKLAVSVARLNPGRLLLVSRGGEPAAADAATRAALAATGARVETVRGDVAAEPRMRDILADCGAALRGVFHCAGSLDDGILLRQSPERVAAVLRPKVYGGWVLHELTRDRELDFFVLFSSMASLLGYRGQGSYAVANAFLDSLALHRTQCGLPALSVSWGSWAGSGMTSRLTAAQQARLLEEGETPILPETGLAALATLMEGRAAHVAVTNMNWASYAAAHAPPPAMIEALAGQVAEAAVDEPAAPVAATLRDAPPEEARRILRDTVVAVVQSLLGGQRIDPTCGFEEMGIDSLGALDLRGRLQSELGIRLRATLAFDHPNVDALTQHLEEQHLADAIRAEARPRVPVGDGAADVGCDRPMASETVPQPQPGPTPSDGPVAIIGMSCRFPGAGSPEEFWKLLEDGRDAVREIPAGRWNVEEYYDASPDVPGKMYVRHAALIDDAGCFDAGFFGISPREATNMDPRQRMLLEAAWSAIEAAGIDPASLRGSDTAVYLGCDEFANDYLRKAAPHLGSEPYIATGMTLSFTAGRLSHKLGLHGPSMVIATACSSSLVALHAAVRAIRHGDCGMAIVGGAKLILGPHETVQLCKLRALAPDGHTKAFAAGADGFGRGEGCAAVLLKPLDRAVADGDPVLAVIRGTAVNHDGPSSGLTVPNGAAQAGLIARAIEDAGLRTEDVTYVETHGTGTQLGDPIELHALGAAFEGRTEPVLVGSVKANIGHLEEAAGLASVIKVVLALGHDAIPPQIHCDVLNDKIDWGSLPLRVQRTGIAWPPAARRIAGVSSFGMSGTNAHVVLEAYDSPPTSPVTAHRRFLFPFSARDETDLAASIREFVDRLAASHDPAEVAYTLQSGRKRHRCRLAVVAPHIDALRTRLQAFLEGAPDGFDVFRGDGDGDAGRRNGSLDGASRLVAKGELAELAKLWCDGHPIDWSELQAGAVPRRVALPTYRFKRELLWVDGDHAVPGASTPQPVPKIAALEGASVLDSLRVHIGELLGASPEDVSPSTPFDELGADSLTFMRISQFVRDRFEIVISFQQLSEEASTLEDLARLVSSRLTTPVPAATAPVKRTPGRRPAGVSRPGPSTAAMAATQLSERLTDRQARFAAELIEAFAARTRGSKAEAERSRPVMVNCRMLPFRALTKELSYPIVAERSAGARFWDIDGNEYLDISMGYGVHLFGHQPDFVVDALRTQLESGVHIGPQGSQVGRVASLLCDLTRMSRAAFCSSGTEAVMAALRFARAATNRTRFVMFEGSYHGWSDNTLALPAGPQGSIPMARGVGGGAMSDVVVLEYGSAESLETIRLLGPELAAVLVEPVQSRRPDLQPVGFLRELRDITRAVDTALIFDETITGFRVHVGGAQAWSGVRADLVTYGKILGGGLPIGAVAGAARFMDTVDGGAWSYGDDSGPTTPATFFGGTFNKNPMSMAAAHAILARLKADSPGLQDRLAANMEWLADEFNAFCRNEGFPLRMVHFSSLFRFIGEGDYSLQRFPIAIDLFFHMLALEGLYVLETRVCFLSASHTTDDLHHIVETAKSCLRAMRSGGFFGTPRGVTSVPARPVAPSAARPCDRLVADAQLDGNFAVPPATSPGNYQDVLLTGATGFLGSHLAYDLLRHTSVNVHCLVRAGDPGHARERVIEGLVAIGCLDEPAHARIIGIPADLARPRLGLADATWDELGGQIDAIYHNGAHVNSLLSYDKLRAANVEGTRELLRLAVDGKGKALHYISSDAVFDAYGYFRQATIYEDQPLTHSDSLFGGGYAETKWVADKLVENARAAGLRASIYRPGTITGELASGCGQLGDYFSRFIGGVVKLGMCPDIDATIDLLPVDLVSQMIVDLSQEAGPGRTFHLTHPDPMTFHGLVEAIRDAGHGLDIVSLHVWEAALRSLRYEDGNPLYPLLPLFTESTDPIFRRARLDVRNARAGAPALSATCPALSELIPIYLDRWCAAGFLERAATEPAGG